MCQGFGGKFGVQSDRQDKSAHGFGEGGEERVGTNYQPTKPDQGEMRLTDAWSDRRSHLVTVITNNCPYRSHILEPNFIMLRKPFCYISYLSSANEAQTTLVRSICPSDASVDVCLSRLPQTWAVP